jgi:DNA polymerase (family X)
MTNKEIAFQFDLFANVLELKGDNPFKIRGYQNVYRTLKKWDQPLNSMSRAELEAIPAVGKGTTDKILELLDTGQMAALETAKSGIPDGVIDMLQVPGIGPKKVLIIWNELGIESPGELLYACYENRLIEAKGFGTKSQDEMRNRLEFFFGNRGKLRWPQAKVLADIWIDTLQKQGIKAEIVGELARFCPIVEQMDLLTTDALPNTLPDGWSLINQTTDELTAKSEGGMTLILSVADIASLGTQQVIRTGPAAFISEFDSLPKATSEADFWTALGTEPVPAPMRDLPVRDRARLPKRLIAREDMRQLIHNHTTWSDGMHDLPAMAAAAKAQGFESITITDHSRSAGYARGLSIERLEAQWIEIDQLNAADTSGFKILKGIESDILTDGRLDYPEDFLARFDLIVSSVHAPLRMDEATATQRILTAVANPATRVLGHPTGRLLLSRAGYPIDHRAVIEACAKHQVAIELNANPARLDLDWSWIPYAVECGVLIAINPDAHSREGINDIQYGIQTAWKAGLTAEQCLNCLPFEAFMKWVKRG